MRVQEPESRNRNRSKPADSTVESQATGRYLRLVTELVNSVECGACNSIIYRPEGAFDPSILEANKNKHYAESPNCRPKVSSRME